MTIKTFAGLGLSEATLAVIEDAGFETPTAVQIEGVPAFLGESDVIIQAQTGTGKTAAFVWPAVETIAANPGTVEMLVLTPTRELAKQVANEFVRFGAPHGIGATAIYGGTSFQAQYDALETAQAVVATPGRLLDLLRRKKITLRNVRFFGLDEADELLSMGFEKDVLDVISHLPEQRQSFLCSATINDDIMRVARSFISDPVSVDVSSDQIGAKNVRHETFKVTATQKLEALRRLVHSSAKQGAIVFANTRAATFRVTDALAQEDIPVDVLNGDLSQREREAALARMRADEIKFLVATDVAARGIDISGLPAVINYDMPESPDVYIHRTGRTGRAGQAGVAYSLVAPSDISVFHALEKFYKLEFHPRTVPTNEELSRVRADAAIDHVLTGLDGGADLPYAGHIPLARRLQERADGMRIIAKLIAHFATSAPRQAVAEAPPAPRDTETKAKAAPAPETGRDDTPVAQAPPEEPDTASVSESKTNAPDAGVEPREAAAAPASPRRTRRKTAARLETPAPEPVARPDETGRTETLSGDSDDAVYEWFAANPGRRRGRWRGARAVAEALGMTTEAVEQAARADARLEESRKEPGRFRTAANEQRKPDAATGRRQAEPAAQQRPEATDAAPERAEAATEDKADRAESNSRKRKARPNAAASKPRRPSPAIAAQSDVTFVPLRLSAGTSRVGDVDEYRRLLVEAAGLDIEDIGGLEVHARHSILHVRADYAPDFMMALQDQTVGGAKLRITRPRKSK